MMELFETIQKRRTVRSFTGAALPCEDIEKIVDAGRLAASGVNQQPWTFVAVTDAALMQKLRVPDEHWSKGAGAYIAVVMNPESRWWVEDAAAAVQNMLLACTALGYGACWMEGYTLRNEEAFKAVLGIPENRRLFTLLAVGVPDEIPNPEKKPLGEVLRWQQY